jgi:hypothetical protein
VAKKKGSTSAPGPTEVGSWNNQIIPTGDTVISGTPATTGFAGATAVGVNPQAQALYNMSNAERAQIAQALKNAGYKGFPTNGLYNQALANAYSAALMAAQTSAMQLGQPFDQNFFTGYLGQEIAARGAMGEGAGPRVTEQMTVATDEQAKAIIDAVFKDQFGRSASEKELKKYTNAIQKAQKKSPVVTTTTKVGGKTMVTTSGGINATQYLLDRVSGTDEAKANKVLDYYETFMKALGAD